MIRRPTFMQTLRQERHPLALLALLAVGLRVSVIMIGLALSPEVAAAGLGILCQPSVEEGVAQPPNPVHDPAHCICGPTCVHSGQVSAAPETDDVRSLAGPAAHGRLVPIADAGRIVSALRQQSPIRAPPSSLN